MKTIILTIFIFSTVFAQEETVAQDTSKTEEVTASDSFPQQVPSGLESGYKGYAWGSPIDSLIAPSFMNTDSLSTVKSSIVKLGTDSVVVSYFFADSGFWKVEIDFTTQDSNLDAQLSDYKRIEKNISAVYGPPQKTNQKESGPSGSYSNSLEQKFSSAFYRSTWPVTPAIIELLLQSYVLLPYTDLPVFSGNYSVLKLVYYNPDYMFSSQPSPETEVVPSIFDIY